MAGYIGSKASVVSSGAEHKKVFDITTTTTSLTGLVYTPTLVHVFHNGVRLVDGTDYTATSGTTITLTVAAENGDQVVVISYATFQTSDTVSASAGGTFAGAVTVQGAFTSLGIDDNATSTAMTIDSSENVMIGTTDSNPTSSAVNVAGQSFSTTGGVRSTVASNAAATFNRKTDDGPIVLFRKDGTTVGSIGANGPRAYFNFNNTENFGLSSGTYSGSKGIYPSDSAGAFTDNVVDLGRGLNRFKNLYLSGGVYLGGTAAANHLDDYEEGTFTLTLGGVAGGPFGLGKYVKVGRLVHFQWYSSGTFTATASSASFTGLPFITAPSSYYSVFSAFHNSYCATASGGYLDTNATSGVFINLGAVSAASTTVASGRYLMVAGTYYTDQ